MMSSDRMMNTEGHQPGEDFGLVILDHDFAARPMLARDRVTGALRLVGQ